MAHEHDMVEEDPAALRHEIRRLRGEIASLAPGLEGMLRQRGFHIHAREPTANLLVPGKEHIEGFHARMHRYSFRLFLRDVIKKQDSFSSNVCRYCGGETGVEYCRYVQEIGLAEQTGPDRFRLAAPLKKTFGPTLEWFLAEMFKREFLTDVMWGVKFRGSVVGGDYDILARIDGTILYLEAKSKPPRQVYPREIAAFLDRTDQLRPGVAVFFMDTQLRMADKMVPMFEEALSRRRPSPPSIERLAKELFRVGDSLFIVNAAGGILLNIEKVLSWFFRHGQAR